MPLYEYECGSCAHRFELIQKFSDPLVKVCPSCGGVVRKLLSSSAIHFKGAGWYVTDARKGKPGEETSETTTKPASESKPAAEPATTAQAASTASGPAKKD